MNFFIKRSISYFGILLVLSTFLSGCKSQVTKATSDTNLRIVATLFPQYDFVRQVAGNLADITLLTPPGVESHTYEPSPADIIEINEADLFIYTGRYMEPWAESILSGLSNDVSVLDVSQNIQLDELQDEDETNASNTKEHVHTVDPHIWTSPVNAQLMVSSIKDALCKIDNKNAQIYEKNAEDYISQLKELDTSLHELVNNAKRREIVFAGRFAFHYFAKEYGLNYMAAYDSCSSETEPSARAVADIITYIRSEGIPAIYYEELVEPKVARSISEETGVQMLLLHSCHNVSKQDLEAGVTYLSLMRQNDENLKVGLT